MRTDIALFVVATLLAGCTALAVLDDGQPRVVSRIARHAVLPWFVLTGAALFWGLCFTALHP